jgi:hypothetical protein
LEYIFDGEVHSLNDEFFYIIERYNWENEKNFNEKNMRRKFLDKYILYLFSVDFTAKEIEDIINNSTHHFTFIHKKPWELGPLDQYGTYAMKFKKERR